MYTRVSVRGQIVIPSKIRRKFGIKKGTRIHLNADEKTHRIILTPITRDYIFSLRGKGSLRNNWRNLASYFLTIPKYRVKALLKVLMEERGSEIMALHSLS